MKKLIRVVLLLGVVLLLPVTARAQNAAATAVQNTINQVQAFLNTVLAGAAQFNTADLNLAIADANAQTPPMTEAAACWTSIKSLNLLQIPQGAGLAYLKQRVLDYQSQYVVINQNCGIVAPAFVKVFDTFIQQVTALNL